MSRPATANSIISYREMCDVVGVQTLQRGMNYNLRPGLHVILMSLRPNAPYADRVRDEGRVLIYEGHDAPRFRDGPDPKTIDQPEFHPGGGRTQNGLFHAAAQAFKSGEAAPIRVRVFEKIWSGVWADNGRFALVDSWRENADSRLVFKFRLDLTDALPGDAQSPQPLDIEHTRLIPSEVKLQVWKRDRGQCVRCGATDNLHFDHIIPYSKGGSSLVASNIQLLCARHNLEKRDKIE